MKWRAWGIAPGYILSDGPHVKAGFERITAPMLFYSLTDDRMLGPDKAVQAIVDTYANAQTERRHVTPKDLGVKAIGHFGFFTSKFSGSLWKQAAEWLEK